MSLPRILDATAGNRTIWRTKRDPRILFIDIEPELEFKPDMLLDCTKTGFPDGHFHTIIFDPPHIFGQRPGKALYACRNRAERMAWVGRNSMPAYYGGDKFRTRRDLIRFVYQASKELYRILADDGVLFLKWNDAEIPLEVILAYLKWNWREMIRLNIGDPTHTLAETNTFWMLFMKKRARYPRQIEFNGPTP